VTRFEARTLSANYSRGGLSDSEASAAGALQSPAAGAMSSIRLRWCYRFSAGTLGPAAFAVANALALVELLEWSALHCRVVKEQFSALSLDKAKTLVRNQLLDSAFCHAEILRKKRKMVIALQHGKLESAKSEVGDQRRDVHRDHRNVRGRPPKSDLRGRISKEGKAVPSATSLQQYSLFANRAIEEMTSRNY
jgi:hypothetical protein